MQIEEFHLLFKIDSYQYNYFNLFPSKCSYNNYNNEI